MNGDELIGLLTQADRLMHQRDGETENSYTDA